MHVAYCLFEVTCSNMLCVLLASQGQPGFLFGAYSESVTVWQKPLRFREIWKRKRWETHFWKKLWAKLTAAHGGGEKRPGSFGKQQENELKDDEAKDYTT